MCNSLPDERFCCVCIWWIFFCFIIMHEIISVLIFYRKTKDRKMLSLNVDNETSSERLWMARKGVIHLSFSANIRNKTDYSSFFYNYLQILVDYDTSEFYNILRNECFIEQMLRSMEEKARSISIWKKNLNSFFWWRWNIMFCFFFYHWISFIIWRWNMSSFIIAMMCHFVWLEQNNQRTIQHTTWINYPCRSINDRWCYIFSTVFQLNFFRRNHSCLRWWVLVF